MINRISSFHNYQSVQNDLRRQETKIHHNQAQLASGKKLLKPGDNPLATHYIQNVSQQEEQLRQYIDSIVLVRNRLEHQEVIITNCEDFVDKARRNVMEMINGALNSDDRLAHQRQLEELSDNILTLANTQDESGNYIFAGTKPQNQPFFRDQDNNVSYTGDDYQRKMRISNSIEIPFNNPGNKVYMQIANPYGNYEPDYQLQEGSELLLEKATNLESTDDASYKVTFVDMGNGKYGYQLEKNDSVVQADEFDPGKGIQYEGLTIHVKGQVTKGDVINLTRRDTFSLFDTLKGVIDHAQGSVSDASNTAKLQQYTKELQASYTHLNNVQTDLGARQTTLDNEEQQHEDFKVSLAKTRSTFEDLDYADAVIDFSENTRALQASQQAFGKTKDLTLFNFI